MRLTVIFFDTNVLVYFAINQDTRKQSLAQAREKYK
jgi:predicted nucleic acid-binding protein